MQGYIAKTINHIKEKRKITEIQPSNHLDSAINVAINSLMLSAKDSDGVNISNINEK